MDTHPDKKAKDKAGVASAAPAAEPAATPLASASASPESNQKRAKVAASSPSSQKQAKPAVTPHEKPKTAAKSTAAVKPTPVEAVAPSPSPPRQSQSTSKPATSTPPAPEKMKATSATSFSQPQPTRSKATEKPPATPATAPPTPPNGSGKTSPETRGSAQGACTVCKAPATKKCGRCMTAYYCCEAHQKGDWKRHKLACKRGATKSADDDDDIEAFVAMEDPPTDRKKPSIQFSFDGHTLFGMMVSDLISKSPSSWCDGLDDDEKYEWLVDCYRLHATTVARRKKKNACKKSVYSLYTPSTGEERVAQAEALAADFFKFCVLGTLLDVIPCGDDDEDEWNWKQLVQIARHLLPEPMDEEAAWEKHGSDAFFTGHFAGQRSLPLTAQLIYEFHTNHFVYGNPRLQSRAPHQVQLFLLADTAHATFSASKCSLCGVCESCQHLDVFGGAELWKRLKLGLILSLAADRGKQSTSTSSKGNTKKRG
ncbi:hypothetical protein HDU96_006586 [Phlyctochytrium bullatum]|nr:hypothetical protein HDU96_006586 [Phlyctochytrium bullatum]